GLDSPVKAAKLFAFTWRVRAENTDVVTDAEENVHQKLRAEVFFFSSRRRHTRSVSAFLLNRSSDLTATKEIQYLNAKGALTYTDIAGDPVLYGNLPPREISMKDVFRSGDSSKKFKIAEGQWYRYAPSYVSPAYHLLEGFPFIQEPPSGDLQE